MAGPKHMDSDTLAKRLAEVAAEMRAACVRLENKDIREQLIGIAMDLERAIDRLAQLKSGR
jgi:hypothetical protein